MYSFIYNVNYFQRYIYNLFYWGLLCPPPIHIYYKTINKRANMQNNIITQV